MSFVDPDYVYCFANATQLDYWGRVKDDLIGRTVADLVGEQRFQAVVRPRLDLALAGQPVSYETTFDFPTQGNRHVEVTYLPACNDAGDIIGVIVRVHDIHTLKLREEQLQTSVSLLEHKTLEQQRFIHIISHDLREPNRADGWNGGRCPPSAATARCCAWCCKTSSPTASSFRAKGCHPWCRSVPRRSTA